MIVRRVYQLLLKTLRKVLNKIAHFGNDMRTSRKGREGGGFWLHRIRLN